MNTIQSGEVTIAKAKVGFLEMMVPLASHWQLLIICPLVVGVSALGGAFLIAPTYTAKTVFLPPQQQQSSAASALAALGPLAGLAGGTGIRTAADQYISLLQSVTIEDRIVDHFKLMDFYKAKYRFEARSGLEERSRITLGKKDGLIAIEVDASEPKLAADIANQYVAELRRLSSELALTEVKQRRIFFEAELKQARLKLSAAQEALQSGGFNSGALKAEPKVTADAYARIKAELTNAEVRLQTIRRSMADNSSDVQQQLALIGALRTQLNKLESTGEDAGDNNYVGRYRDFKYQETLFDLLSKQYEAARLDESRESALIQVVDPATAPEYKSRPKRAFIAFASAAASLLLLIIAILVRHFWRQSRAEHASGWLEVGRALRGKAG